MHWVRALRWRVPGPLHAPRGPTTQILDHPVSPPALRATRSAHLRRTAVSVRRARTEPPPRPASVEFSFTEPQRCDLQDGRRGAERMVELWLGGEDDHTSSWMRSTSPSGLEAYGGRVNWSGELGFGVRPPEHGQKPAPLAGRVVEAIVSLSVCAAAVLVGAIGVITGRNPVHCALFLLVTLVSVVVLYLQQHAALVAAIQIVVYAKRDRCVVLVRHHKLLGVDRHEVLDDEHPLQRITACWWWAH